MKIVKRIDAGLVLAESMDGGAWTLSLLKEDGYEVLSRILLHLQKFDAFGYVCRRITPRFEEWMSQGEGSAKTLWKEILTAVRRRGYREILLPLSHGKTALPDRRLVEASEAGFVADITVPEVFFRRAARRRAIRLIDVQSPPERLAKFGRGYAEALESVNFGTEVAFEITVIESILLNLLKAELANEGFHERYGVRRILSIGSTDRKTYAWLPVDFDLMVETTLPQEEIDLDRVRDLLARLARKIEVLPELKNYLDSNPRRSSDHPLKVFLTSLGLRGQASLVARFDVVGHEAARDQRHGFLDITFGNVARPSDYAIWMKRYLAKLPVELRRRLILELRLTKRSLKLLEGVYGSEDIGLRPITVEQMVIQHMRYHPSGILAGTFDSVMQHLCEEATEKIGDSRYQIIDFHDFKHRFPVWRPGIEGDALEIGAISEQINLFDLLANGNSEQAQQKWNKIVAFAVTYQRARERGGQWTIGGLIRQAQEAYRASASSGNSRQICFM